MADFNKNFNGHTVVLPDTAEKILGKFGQSLQSMSSRGELVKLEDPEFEKEFCVYGDDQVEARYILSPALMKRRQINTPTTSKAEQLLLFEMDFEKMVQPFL